MSNDDLERRARRRQEEVRTALARLVTRPPDAVDPVVLKIFDNGHKPAAVPGMYAGHPVTFSGAAAEGAPVTFTTDTTRKVIVTVWSHPPAVGDLVIADRYSGQWHSEEGGANCHGRLCVNAYHCGYYRDVGSGLADPDAGAAVTVTGPGGFSASGTTDSGSRWCTDVTATGTYTVTCDDGDDAQTKTVVVNKACASYEVGFCMGGELRIELTVFGCQPFPGIYLEFFLRGGTGGVITDGPVLAHATTDENGRVSVCLPHFDADPMTTALYVRAPDPPCPWAPTDWNTGATRSLCSIFTVTRPLSLKLQQGFTCFCGVGNFPVPSSPWTVTLAGEAFDYLLGSVVCRGVPTALLCKMTRVDCSTVPYGHLFLDVLSYQSGTTAYGLQITCGGSSDGPRRLHAVIEFVVLLQVTDCSGDTLRAAFPPWDGTCFGLDPNYLLCVPDGALPLTDDRSGVHVLVRVDVDLSGTVDGHSLSASGAVPAMVGVGSQRVGGRTYPAVVVPVPCAGPITVSASWC